MATNSIIVQIRIIAQNIAQVTSQVRNFITQLNTANRAAVTHAAGMRNAQGATQSFFSQIGGAAAGIRAFSGVLRAAGTAGFLVGGQFRTLGFALSASSALLQNFGPLILNIVGALGPLATGIGIVALGIGGYFTAQLAIATGAIGLTIIGLTELIKVGFKFSSEYETAAVSIGALVDQLFVLKDASGKVLEGQDALNAGIVIADGELKKLRIDALQTKFTFQELFTVLQAGIAASAGTKGSVEDIRKAVVGLTQLASARGILPDQLVASINQAILGTLRVTNRLKSSLADVFGVSNKDVNSYIQNLRKEGILFDELNKKLVIFKLAGQLQAMTFTGIINNLQDALQIFASDSTKKAFDILKENLQGALATVFDFSTRDFAAPFKELASLINDVLGDVFTFLADKLKVVINGVIFIINQLLNNKVEVFDIVHLVELIATQIISMIASLLAMFGFTNDVKESLDTIRTYLIAVRIILVIISDIFHGIAGVTDALVGALALILKGVATLTLLLATLTGNTALAAASSAALSFYTKLTEYEAQKTAGHFHTIASESTATLDTLEKMRAKMSEFAFAEQSQFQSFVKTLSTEDINKTLNYIQQQRKNPDFSEDKIVTKTFEDELKIRNANLGERKRLDAQADKDRAVSTLAAEHALNEAKRKLADDAAQQNLKSLQDRLKNEEDILKNQLDDQLISIDQYYKDVQFLRNKDFDAQETTQARLLQDSQKRHKEELDSINEDIKRVHSNAEAARGKLGESAGTSVDEISNTAAQQQLETKKETTQVRVLELKIQTENVKFEDEQQKILTEINLLEQQRPEAAAKFRREIILQNQALQEQLRNFRELSQTIQEDTTSDAFLTTQMRNFVEQNKTAILELQRQTVVGGEIGAKAKLTLDNILRSEIDRLDIERTLAQIELSRIPFKEHEDQINQDISLGLIDQIAGEQKLIELHRKEAIELQKQADALQQSITEAEIQAGGPTPATIKFRQQLEALRVEIVGLSQVTEHVLIKASDDARTAFTTFFEDLISGTDSVKAAFSNLALSILKSFQKLLADKIVQDLFGTKGVFGNILSPAGQTTGPATGVLAKVLRSLGLDPNSTLNKPIGGTAAQVTPEILQAPVTTKLGIIETILGEINAKIQALIPSVSTKGIVNDNLNATGTQNIVGSEDISTGVRTTNSTSTTLGGFVGRLSHTKGERFTIPMEDGNFLVYTDNGDGTYTKSILASNQLDLIKLVNPALPLSNNAPNISAPNPADTAGSAPTTLDKVRNAAGTNNTETPSTVELGTVTQTKFDTDFTGIKTPLDSINEEGLVNLQSIINEINGFMSEISNTIVSLFDAPITAIISAIQSISTNSGGESSLDGIDLGDLSDTLGAAGGGFVSGRGSTTSDSIPAMLSDQEYVVNAKAVKKYGIGFMESINREKFAEGGLAGGGLLSGIFGSGGFLSKLFGGGGSKGGSLLTAFLPFLVGMLGGKKSKITGSLLSLLGLYYSKKNKKAAGGLVQHFDGGGAAVGLGALGGSSQGVSGGFLGSAAGSGLISAGISIGIALLSRLFAKKAPKSDPNRTVDPYGLNPDTLTFYKHPIIQGVRNYLAGGGLVTGSSLAGSTGYAGFASGGLANTDSILSGLPDPSDSSGGTMNFKQNINITTPDLHSFKNSKNTLARELGKMAQRGLAGRRRRV